MTAHSLKTEIMMISPPLRLDVERFEIKQLDHFECQAPARIQIENDYRKWQDNYQKLTLIKKYTFEHGPIAGAGRGRGRGKNNIGVLNFNKVKMFSNGDAVAVIRKRQEEEDERYARELQKKLDRENGGSPSRAKKVEIDEAPVSEKYKAGVPKGGKSGLRISIRKGEQATAQVHGLATMSKYGRQRKLNRFLRQSDSDSSYGEKKKKPNMPTKGQSQLKKKIVIELDDEDPSKANQGDDRHAS